MPRLLRLSKRKRRVRPKRPFANTWLPLLLVLLLALLVLGLEWWG